MLNKEMKDKEELKDVLTAISVVAKRLRDKVEDNAEDNSNDSTDGLLKVTGVAGQLIGAHNTLGELRKANTCALYKHSGAPEYKDYMDGIKKANDWYTETRKDILETIVSLGSGSESMIAHAKDLIELAEGAREEKCKEIMEEATRSSDKVVFGRKMTDGSIAVEQPKGYAEPVFPDYEAVRKGTLLGTDGTLQLDRYSDENVEFSRDFCALEGALQEDHNKRVEIYEILSSMSPAAYKWGKKTRADLLRQLADEIELAETLN